MGLQSLNSKTLYEVLGVAENATREEIAQGFDEIMRIYGSDSTHYLEIIEIDQDYDHQQVVQLVQYAYKTLSDETLRAAYNDDLFFKRHKRLRRTSDLTEAAKLVQEHARNEQIGQVKLNAKPLATEDPLDFQTLSGRYLSINEIMARRNTHRYNDLLVILLGLLGGAVIGALLLFFRN